MDIVGYIILIIFGLCNFILGYWYSNYIFKNTVTYGKLIINETDPEFATCGLKFDSDFDEVKSKKHVLLSVQSDSKK